MNHQPALPTFGMHWPEGSLERWSATRRRLSGLRQSVGHGDAFRERCAHLRALCAEGAAALTQSMPRSRANARALTHLWLVEPEFRARCLTGETLQRLAKLQSPRLSRQTHLNLLALYFQAFDALDASEPLRPQLAETLAGLWPHPRRPSERRGPWTALEATDGRLLAADGPAQIAADARAQGKSLETWITQLGLGAVFKGRFAELALGHFYLDALENLPTGAADPLLDRLARPETHNLPFEQGQRLGHAALAHVIDRDSEHPGALWLQWLLSIAGDPRTAPEAASRRQWWNVLGETRRARVVGWLGHSELELFLDALRMEQAQADPASREVFAVRETFLAGLAASGAVQQARLIAGSEVIEALRAMSEAPASLERIARLEGDGAGPRAVIYLKGRGFHLLDSTRDWRTWLYLDLPDPSLSDARRDRFSVTELLESLPARYGERHPGLTYTACSHGSTWTRHIIGFLADHGVGLDLSRVLSPEHQRQYLARYGEPIIRRPAQR
ncbi:MAG: EH signature domain-containing protein [Halothiobacillaceae bacterium]